mmetsp:Transcript_14288/g.34826  ORF Transcript_14288/g.34826 Transcript_14288/m.34826 type:complete len:116 (+) Transcript_14288:153-500(+)
MEVEGAIYPPTYLNQLLSQLCFYALFGIIALMFVGDNLFKSFEFPLGARLVEHMKTNFYATMMVAFFLNMAAQQLVATGAFEISIDDELVFSKLDTGRLPSLDLLHGLAEKYSDM